MLLISIGLYVERILLHQYYCWQLILYSTMEIKSTDGNHNVTGIGQGTYNTIAGSLGLASFLGLGGNGNGIGGLFGGRNSSEYVTKEEFQMAQTIAAKDSEIALLKSEQNTEIKIADVYERVMTRVNQDQRDQAAWNAQQAVYNGTNNAALSCLQNQVASLASLTKVIVPATSVCPQPMAMYNSWTAPTTSSGSGGTTA